MITLKGQGKTALVLIPFLKGLHILKQTVDIVR